MSASQEHGNGTIMKAGAVLLSIAAVIGGLAAVVSPMANSIATLREDHKKSESEWRDFLRRHEDLKGHAGTLTEQATMRESFREIETQFRWFREVFTDRVGNNATNIQDLRDRMRQAETAVAVIMDRLRKTNGIEVPK